MGVPIPTIPKGQLEEYQDFLKSLGRGGFEVSQKAASAESMSLATLRKFEAFLNLVMSDKVNADVPHWKEMLFRVVNEEGQLTFACAEELGALQKA